MLFATGIKHTANDVKFKDVSDVLRLELRQLPRRRYADALISQPRPADDWFYVVAMMKRRVPFFCFYCITVHKTSP